MSEARRDQVVTQAASWLVRLEQDRSAATRQAWQVWHDADPVHAEVWRRFSRVQGVLPACDSAAATALSQVDFGVGRRRALKLLVLAGGAGGGALALVGEVRRTGWMAEHRTAAGEQRRLALGGNAVLMMNTGTALDVSRQGRQLDIVLHGGEIMLDTRRDDTMARVMTRHGAIEATRAHLAVRVQHEATRVALGEGQAAIETRGQLNAGVPAGQVRRFNAAQVSPQPGWAGHEFAWVQGMLIADGMRLDAFLEELARYRPGVLRCAAGVAHWRVDGSFRVMHTDQVLMTLAQVMGLKLTYRTRYWVQVDRLDI